MMQPEPGEPRLEDELANLEREIENEIEKLKQERLELERKRKSGEAVESRPWAPSLIVE
jgi:hypothetical protein